MVAAGGILTAMTFPGQTAGLSPFTDPLLAQLDIDRTAISLSYLIATLTGALTMPVLGRVMDKYGTKRAIIWIGVYDYFIQCVQFFLWIRICTRIRVNNFCCISCTEVQYPVI